MFAKGGSKAGGGGGSSAQRGGQKPKSQPPKWIFKALWICTLVAAGAIAFANMRPYINVVRYFGIGLLDKFFYRAIAHIPVINAIAATGIGIITLICGVALWAVFQIIEVLPVVIYNHEGFLEEVISDAESAKKYNVNGDEDPTIRGLKQIYNKLPIAFLENLAKVRMIAYALDFCICFWNYSPVRSGKISDFFYFLATGQWNKINYTNLLLILVTLFGVEVAVMLLLWIGKLAFTMKRATR